MTQTKTLYAGAQGLLPGAGRSAILLGRAGEYLALSEFDVKEDMVCVRGALYFAMPGEVHWTKTSPKPSHSRAVKEYMLAAGDTVSGTVVQTMRTERMPVRWLPLRGLEPTIGDLITSEAIEEPKVFCGAFRGEWILSGKAGVALLTFTSPHDCTILSAGAHEDLARAIFEDARRIPLPGAPVYTSKGQGYYISRDPTDILSHLCLVPYVGHGNSLDIDGEKWTLKRFMLERINAHDLPNARGIELQKQVVSWLSP